MNSETSVIGLTRQSRHHYNRVSFTEEDFMDRDMRGHLFDKTNEEEQVPPADKKVFDHSPEDVRMLGFSNIRSRQDDWTHGPLPVYDQSTPIMLDDDVDAIRIPSLDANLKWSPQNPMITVPHIGHTTLARAVSSGEASIHGTQLSILEELKRMTHRQTMKPKPSVQLAQISEAEITDRDVICERGGKSNRHAGTKRYRGMIEKFKPEYQSLAVKTAKTNLSRKIISRIQENGGRFLKKYEKSQQYFVLSPVETTKKVSQAMREKKALKWTENCTSTKSEKKAAK